METVTKKILQTFIKHCNVIDDTIKHFGLDFDDFNDNIIYQNAVLTPVIQIGELVKRLPDTFRIKYAEIPWRNIAGMRDILVHKYETIDKVILWNIVKNEIPKIKTFSINILKEEI